MMPSGAGDVFDRTRTDSWHALPDAELPAKEDYLSRRAQLRATEAAYDLFQALRAGDMAAARWLLDEVYPQVVILTGK